MKWEYKTIYLEAEHIEDSSALDELLNDLGAEEWELINIIPQVGSTTDFSVGDVDLNFNCCESVFVKRNICVFKKPKV